jgi:F-type H+-transporting ATPase subunit a
VNMRIKSISVAAVALALVSAVAWGSSGEGGHGEAGHDTDVAGYIFHHVSDSTEYEFEVPGPLFTGENPKIDLAHTFGFLRIETQPGACPADPHESGSIAAGCLDLRPTKHVLMMWLAAVLLIVAMLLGGHRDRNKPVPHGVSANLIELLVLFVRDEIAIKNIGKEDGPRYVSFLLTAFFFILAMNLLGLFPWMASANGNLAITCGLAICTFVVTQIAGIRSAGLGGYLKHLTGGVAWWLWPIMVPVEILGLFTKPFALTVRLFANMLAGHIVIFFLLGLIFLMHPAMAVVSVPMAMAIYFLELFVAFVQAYVFTMLSSLFIGMAVATGHHGHDDSHGDHADHAHHPVPAGGGHGH